METIQDIKKIKYSPFLKPIKPYDKEKHFFYKLTDVLISYHILPFFENKEAKDFGKLNTLFYNAFTRYYERNMDSYIEKYNVKIENNNNQNKIYEQKDEKGHFIKLSFLNLEHYLLFSYIDWSWKNDQRYWYTVTPKNSLFNKDIYELRAVSLFDINGNLSHIFYGKYKLYLNQCVCNLEENKLKMLILLDGNQLEEFIYPSRQQVNKCREIHGNKEGNHILIGRPRSRGGPLYRYPRTSRFAKQIDYNPENKLNKEFILDFIVPYNQKIDDGSGHTLNVKFQQRDDSWKIAWLIDAIIVEKVN